MRHQNRMLPYLLGAAVVAAVLIAVGAPLTTLLPFAFVLVCPIMMFMMMRGMSGGMRGGMRGGNEDHTGRGCEHDHTRQPESPNLTRR